jgi:hypothetical protein
MPRILIDSSVWIDYFRDAKSFPIINDLILENVGCTNDLILAEIIPALRLKKSEILIDSLFALDKIDLNLNWQRIMNYQFTNLKNGINGVGVADLIILDSAVSNNLSIFSKDRHFKEMNKFFDFHLYDYEKI